MKWHSNFLTENGWNFTLYCFIVSMKAWELIQRFIYIHRHLCNYNVKTIQTAVYKSTKLTCEEYIFNIIKNFHSTFTLLFVNICFVISTNIFVTSFAITTVYKNWCLLSCLISLTNWCSKQERVGKSIKLQSDKIFSLCPESLLDWLSKLETKQKKLET